jgi:MFS family permease
MKFLLINRNFACIWIGKIISQIGDKFYAIALVWWILKKTNSPGIMGVFLLLSVLPGLILGFYAGAIADRMNRKKLMIVTDVIRGALVAIVVVLSYADILKIWHIFLIGAAMSSVSAFFEPAQQAIIPQIVDKSKLKKANSLNQMVSGLSAVIGPILGSTTISLLGIPSAFLINSISFFLSSIFAFFVKYKDSDIINYNENSVYKDIKEGVLFLKKSEEILYVIYIIAIVHFFMGSLMVSLPFLSNCLHGQGVQNLGYLETFLGIGLILGAVYIGGKRISNVQLFTLIFIIICFGICFLLISIFQYMNVNSLYPYLAAFLLIGCSISSASVFWMLLLQLHTPEHMMGRVFGVSSMVGNVSTPIAYGIFGVLLTYSPIKILMLISGGCLVLLSGILLLFQWSKKLS